MLKLPPVATSVGFCDPPFSEPFEETREFQWNVEAAVGKAMSFSYWIGDGPLYWFRIDWYPNNCSISCMSTTPVISTTNCPYDIEEQCLILPPTCGCISCSPGQKCISITVETWHMLATNVVHLCERINSECCNSKPKGFIRRVRQYMRPALCCDVANNPGKDEYVDVDFLKCECGNLVDPCVAKIVYPCHINHCGIHGPAVKGNLFQQMNVTADLLGHTPKAFSVGVSTSNALEIVPPKAKPESSQILTKSGKIPTSAKCKLNSVLISLFYNGQSRSWHGSINHNDLHWVIDTDFSKFNVIVSRKGKYSKANLVFRSLNINNRGKFGFNLNLNKNFVEDSAILTSKTVKDDLGVFKDGLTIKME